MQLKFSHDNLLLVVEPPEKDGDDFLIEPYSLQDSERLFIFNNDAGGTKFHRRRALIYDFPRRMKAIEALRLRKQRSINYKVMPLDWWERQKRLPDVDEEGLVLLKKQDYMESIRLFRREIFTRSHLDIHDLFN